MIYRRAVVVFHSWWFHSECHWEIYETTFSPSYWLNGRICIWKKEQTKCKLPNHMTMPSIWEIVLWWRYLYTCIQSQTHPHIYVFVCVAKLNWKRREELKRQIYGDTDALEWILWRENVRNQELLWKMRTNVYLILQSERVEHSEENKNLYAIMVERNIE